LSEEFQRVYFSGFLSFFSDWGKRKKENYSFSLKLLLSKIKSVLFVESLKKFEVREIMKTIKNRILKE